MNKKTAIITGANSGIGLATTKIFLKHGYNITGVDLRTDTLEKLTNDYPNQLTYFSGDISLANINNQMIDYTIQHFGNVDVLVNNAGIIDQLTPAADMSDDMLDKVMKVNFYGHFYAMRHFIQYLLKSQRQGAIVSTSSVGGNAHPTIAGAAYASSKAALIQLTRHVAYSYGAQGIRANAICVGAAPSTGIAKTVTKPNMKGAKDSMKINSLSIRNADPAELGEALFFLASDKASYVNGEIMNVDGGWSCA